MHAALGECNWTATTAGQAGRPPGRGPRQEQGDPTIQAGGVECGGQGQTRGGQWMGHGGAGTQEHGAQ
eukprot:200810-Rhodomonas_salina.1